MSQDGYAPPSINPAHRGSLSGTVKFILTKFLQGVDDMLPAQVLSYDRATNKARVQILVSIITTSDQEIQRAELASVPVMQPGAGGFVLSWPVKAGDLGWIKANDRDISLFLQSGISSPPNSQRKHSFEDAVFILDSMMKQVVIDPADENSVTLQSVDGSVKISLSETGVTIKGGTITLEGDVATVGTLTNNGVNVGSTHEHSGVQPGSGNTGAPI